MRGMASSSLLPSARPPLSTLYPQRPPRFPLCLSLPQCVPVYLVLRCIYPPLPCALACPTTTPSTNCPRSLHIPLLRLSRFAYKPLCHAAAALPRLSLVSNLI